MEGIEDLNKNVNTYTHETISHISVIKTYANEDKSNNKYVNLCNQINNYNTKESMLYGIN